MQRRDTFHIYSYVLPGMGEHAAKVKRALLVGVRPLLPPIPVVPYRLEARRDVAFIAFLLPWISDLSRVDDTWLPQEVTYKIFSTHEVRLVTLLCEAYS